MIVTATAHVHDGDAGFVIDREIVAPKIVMRSRDVTLFFSPAAFAQFAALFQPDADPTDDAIAAQKMETGL